MEDLNLPKITVKYFSNNLLNDVHSSLKIYTPRKKKPLYALLLWLVYLIISDNILIYL
jgi:hypothetical protein